MLKSGEHNVNVRSKYKTTEATRYENSHGKFSLCAVYSMRFIGQKLISMSKVLFRSVCLRK